jgi:hypothetical protein
MPVESEFKLFDGNMEDDLEIMEDGLEIMEDDLNLI